MGIRIDTRVFHLINSPFFILNYLKTNINIIMSQKRILIIGKTCSGKTTKAEEIRKEYDPQGKRVIIFDEYYSKCRQYLDLMFNDPEIDVIVITTQHLKDIPADIRGKITDVFDVKPIVYEPIFRQAIFELDSHLRLNK